MKRQFIKSLLMSSVLALVVGGSGVYTDKAKANGGDSSKYFTQCDSGPQSIACGRWDMTAFDRSPGVEYPYLFWLRVNSVAPVSGSITGEAEFYFGDATPLCDTCAYTGTYKDGVITINNTSFYSIVQFNGFPDHLLMQLIPIGNSIFGVTNLAYSKPGSFVAGVRAPKLAASANLVAGPTEVLFPATGGTLNDMLANFNFNNISYTPILDCNLKHSFPCVRFPTRNNWDVINGEIVGLLNNPTDFVGSNGLASKKLYRDFEVSLKIFIAPGANSGLDLRGKYEVAIGGLAIGEPDPHNPLWYTGAIYGKVPAERDNARVNDWNDIKVRFVGRYATVYVNDMVHPVVNNKEIQSPGGVAVPSQSLIHDENDAGPIVLRFDRMWTSLRFKDIRVTPLYPKK